MSNARERQPSDTRYCARRSYIDAELTRLRNIPFGSCNCSANSNVRVPTSMASLISLRLDFASATPFNVCARRYLYPRSLQVLDSGCRMLRLCCAFVLSIETPVQKSQNIASHESLTCLNNSAPFEYFFADSPYSSLS